MNIRKIARTAFAAALILSATAAPGWAMHWRIYAPDTPDHRYWYDSDSVETRGDYIYVTYVWGDPDSLAPTSPDGGQIGIKCTTGDSVQLRDNAWVPGAHFTSAAYLFKLLCPDTP